MLSCDGRSFVDGHDLIEIHDVRELHGGEQEEELALGNHLSHTDFK
jgi:hypothetical protein